MIDNLKLQDALSYYKKDFVQKQWPNEKYKWEAVKHFQDNWDINASDFAEMLTRSLEKTYNLLASMNFFPAGMIEGFAKAAPEEVRAMFIALFDETQDVVQRILNFKDRSSTLLEKYGNGAAQHYQYENAISVYLWLRYPDKYYIYKFSEVKKVTDELGSDVHFKKGGYADNLRKFYALYDELCSELKKDGELRNMLKSQLTDNCYSDPELRTLTIDVGFYISRFYSERNDILAAGEWWPSEEEYTPQLYIEDWKELLADSAVFNASSLEIMKRMLDYGGKATCTQLAVKYGETKNFYNSGSSALAKRVAEKTGCPVLEKNNESAKWWPILYVGKAASADEEGSYIWRLRAELEEALKQTDLSEVKLYANSDNEDGEQRYWWLNANPNMIREDNPLTTAEETIEPYSKEQFLDEVYLAEAKYNRLVSVLLKKKNIILQGAPGVGKTFAAKRLAYSIMGEKDDSRIEFVQFHQNYSYEDFMMGYKPEGDSFELKYGIFYRFCQKAANHPDKDYFFIIDEINRGNMSKIFGELLMLIEKDYRGTKATLAYNGLSFFVPERLHIIGMMNTADRSLAMIDYALRRRFSFFYMEPGFDSEGFMKYQKSLNNETFDLLIEKVVELNREIAADKSLGKGFCIGHSYFCGAKECTTEWMMNVVDFDILPMLSEYWFDDLSKVQRWENTLYGVFQ